MHKANHKCIQLCVQNKSGRKKQDTTLLIVVCGKKIINHSCAIFTLKEKKIESEKLLIPRVGPDHNESVCENANAVASSKTHWCHSGLMTRPVSV